MVNIWKDIAGSRGVTPLRATRDRAPGAEYWKLVSYELYWVSELQDVLQEAGYRHLKSANKDRLQHLQLRAQRGLLSYDVRGADELRRFCNSRGLVVPPRAKKQNLVALLEQADDDATFDRFMDLPPELRVLIYEHHFESFKSDAHALEAPYEPPIASVSRIVRKESQPLFYQVCAFDVMIRTRALGTPAVMNRPMAEFLQSAPDELIAMIRKIHIKFGYMYPTAGWSAELASDGKPAVLSSAFSWSVNGVVRPSAQLEKILQTFLHNLSTRPEGKLLMRNDLDTITQAIMNL